MCNSFFVEHLVRRLVEHHAELHEGDDGKKALPVQLEVMSEAVVHNRKLLDLARSRLCDGCEPFHALVSVP